MKGPAYVVLIGCASPHVFKRATLDEAMRSAERVNGLTLGTIPVHVLGPDGEWRSVGAAAFVLQEIVAKGLAAR